MNELERLDRDTQLLRRQVEERLAQVRYFREALQDAMRALDALEHDIRAITERRERAERQRRPDQGEHGVRIEAFASLGNPPTVPRGVPPSQDLPTQDTRTSRGEAAVAIGAPERDVPDDVTADASRPRHPPPCAPKAGDGPNDGARNKARESFAQAVRRVAHRSIAEAGRSLSRRAILDDLVRAGVSLPATGAPRKVSKILVRDPDLVSDGGRGYRLIPEAWERERQAIKAVARGGV